MSEDQHTWVAGNDVIRWPHCRVCGVIKRADGQNRPMCRGAPRITLRRIEIEATR